MNVVKLIPRSMGERIGVPYRGLMPRPGRSLVFRVLLVLSIAFVLAFFAVAAARAGNTQIVSEKIEGTLVPEKPRRYEVDGAPLTAVVVTSCNLIVAVYMTMPSGALVRFDSSDDIAFEVLLASADTAKVRERVEVGCDIKLEPKFERKEVRL